MYPVSALTIRVYRGRLHQARDADRAYDLQLRAQAAASIALSRERLAISARLLDRTTVPKAPVLNPMPQTAMPATDVPYFEAIELRRLARRARSFASALGPAYRQIFDEKARRLEREAAQQEADAGRSEP